MSDPVSNTRVIVNRTAAYWEILVDGSNVAMFTEHREADLYASGLRYGLYEAARQAAK